MRRLILGLALIVASLEIGCHRGGDANLTEIQRIRSGTLDVVLLSPHDALRHGKDTFIVEFRSTSGGGLVDVGNVHVAASMAMPGMPMFGSIDVLRTSIPGRYAASSDIGMAGTWRMTIDWSGPAGVGSATFAGTVQ